MLAICGTGSSLRDALHLCHVHRRLDERHVGTRLDEGMRAVDRRVEPFNRARVRARDDLQVSDPAAHPPRP